MKTCFNKKYSVAVFIIINLLIFANIDVVSATDYYVAPWGNNTNAGTSLNTSWSTLSYSSNFLYAGDTLNIVDGTYYNDSFVAKNSGNATHPITIKLYNGTPKFISNSTRTADLFNFGDSDAAPGALPQSYYNVGGFTAENYRQVFVTSWNSAHFRFTNFTAINSSFAVHFQRGAHDSLVKNVTIINSYYAPFHFWYNNYNNTIEDISITGTIYDHGILDFHTNNSGFTVRNVSFVGIMEAGEGIYFHGDYGTNNNNYFSNINFTKISTSASTYWESLDIWQPGYNNVFDNMVLTQNGGNTNIIQILQSSTLGSDNFTIKNTVLNQNGATRRGIYIEPSNQINGTLLFENITINNVKNSLGWTDIEFNLNNRIKFIVFRDIKGDKNNIVLGLNALSNITWEYSDNRVFSYVSVDSSPRYYSDKSNLSILNTGTKTITYYPMTARPSFDPATVTVNSFNTALPAGSVLASFTANTINNNNVAFTMSTLTPGKRYFVKVGGATVDTPIADYAGVIQFSHSNWPAGVFTVVEDASYVVTQSRGNATGKSIYVNKTALPAANVTLYYSNGTSYGQTVISVSNGSFQFNNVPAGSYYVIINKQLFEKNQTSVFISANMTTNIGSRSLEFLDVNGDKKIDVLDLSKIYENLPGDGQIYDPVCDVNGDGHVNILDASQVTKNI